MKLGKLLLALTLLGTASWAQFGTADVMKMATERMDMIGKALKLSPDQINKIKPLLQSKFSEMSSVKTNFLTGDRSDASKKSAADSLKSISAKYDNQIDSALNPDQIKKLNGMRKDWKDDLALKIPKF